MAPNGTFCYKQANCIQLQLGKRISPFPDSRLGELTPPSTGHATSSRPQLVGDQLVLGHRRRSVHRPQLHATAYFLHAINETEGQPKRDQQQNTQGEVIHSYHIIKLFIKIK
jgi:hypothetical protein